MFSFLDDIKKYGSITLVIVSLIAIFLSGIFFGITYWTMEVTQDAFELNDCEIHGNYLVSSCQELWSLSVYPFLILREILVWFSFFFIFALVLGMLIVGYQSGKSPVLLGLLIVFIIVICHYYIIIL